jgi:Mg-chelatase subunit ChlD
VDTSIKSDLTTMETIRRELSLFVERRPSKEDRVAIVSASSNPEVMREPMTDPELLKLSISRLTTAGGNAIRDGIETAFNILQDLSSSTYRRAVVVFTSAKDTSSQASVEQLTNRANQLVGRKNVDLFVIAIGGSEQDFGELPAVTRKVGGTFVLTDIPSLPGKFYAIGRRVQ